MHCLSWLLERVVPVDTVNTKVLQFDWFWNIGRIWGTFWPNSGHFWLNSGHFDQIVVIYWPMCKQIFLIKNEQFIKKLSVFGQYSFWFDSNYIKLSQTKWILLLPSWHCKHKGATFCTIANKYHYIATFKDLNIDTYGSNLLTNFSYLFLA
jgi:hypothetical protein